MHSAMRILDQLHRYCPSKEGTPVQVPVNGDALSVERMIQALDARAPSMTAEGRLEGIQPVPQEFHKRGIILQVSRKCWEYPYI